MSEASDLRRAIKAKCLDCNGGSKSQAKACEQTDCPIWACTDWHHKRKTKKELREDGIQVTIKIEIHEK